MSFDMLADNRKGFDNQTSKQSAVQSFPTSRSFSQKARNGISPILHTARDCPVNAKCEVVGSSRGVFWAETPPQQVRGISGNITLPNLPHLRGKLTPQFTVKQVYAWSTVNQTSKLVRCRTHAPDHRLHFNNAGTVSRIAGCYGE
jgi:hypothetical protein